MDTLGPSWRRLALLAVLITLGLGYVAAFAFFVLRSEDFIGRDIDARASAYAAAHPVAPGARLLFTAGSGDLSLLGNGWHRPGVDGVWSGEPEAALFLASAGDAPLALEFDLVAFVPPSRGRVTVVLAAEDDEIGRWRLQRDQPIERARAVLLTTGVVGQPMRLRFEIDAMGVPVREGINRDRRQLGIKLRHLTVGGVDRP